MGEISPVREIDPTVTDTTIRSNAEFVQRCDRLYASKQYTEALTSCRTTLVEAEAGANLRETAAARYRLGTILVNTNNGEEALRQFAQSEREANESGAVDLQLFALNQQANIYQVQGDPGRAVDLYTRALQLNDVVDPDTRAGRSLINARANRGATYYRMSQYAPALADLEVAMDGYRRINYEAGMTSVHINLGLVYQGLAEYRDAEAEYQAALDLARQRQDNRRIAESLLNLGFLADARDDHGSARVSLEAALGYFDENDSGRATTLNNLGVSLGELQQYEAAEYRLNQALELSRSTNHRALEGRVLDSIATVQAYQGKTDLAIGNYHGAYAIQQDTNDRDGQRTTLANLGAQLVEKDELALATVFYKKSVNVTEAIRADIESLPPITQSSYARRVEDTYRELSSLLIEQNRLLEAQQVVDLLKGQELSEFLGPGRGKSTRSNAIPKVPAEEAIDDEYAALAARAIVIARERQELLAIPRAQRTPEQVARLRELDRLEQRLNLEFSQFFDSESVREAIDKLDETVDTDAIELDALKSIGNTLKELKEDHGLSAVVLYPLVLENSVELIVATPESRPFYKQVAVGRSEIRSRVAEFRNALLDPRSDPKALAQQFYTWLVAPIEAELAQLGTEAIWYAPDDALRYIPLAALYDGEHWLIEKFQVNNWTSASKMNLTDTIDRDLKILGGAYTDVTHNFTIADQIFRFLGLPFAAKEVQTLQEVFADSLFFDGKEFVFDDIYLERDNFNVLHLATHAAVVAGQASDSFILFGDGTRKSIRDFDALNFDLELAVLSACETGVGGVADGIEVLGLGYAMQESGARSTVASLWPVSDGGTHVLMSAFYGHLKNGSSRAGALRAAQINLIENDEATIATLNRGLELADPIRARLNHPFYWSAFIIIGSGL